MGKNFTKKINILIISLICTALWGSAFPVLKISYEKLAIESGDIFTKIYFAGIRFFIASLLVFFIAKFILKKKITINKENIKPVVFIGLIQTALQYFFFYIGVSNTSGIKSAILESSGTFFTVIAAHFIYSDDKLNAQKILSLVLGFGGILVVNVGKNFDFSFKLVGEGFLLISSLLATFATFYVKRVSQNVEPVILTGWQMFVGSVFLLITGKIGMGDNKLIFNSVTFGLLIYASFISAVAFLLWYMLLKYNKPGEISIYKLFIPVFGSMLSAIFIKEETFTLKLFLGLILVVLGIIVLNVKWDRKNKTLSLWEKI